MKDTPTNFKSEPNLKGSDLTDEEAVALDEYYTTHVPKVGPNEGGFFANPARRLMPVDELSAAYIRSACEAWRQ